MAQKSMKLVHSLQRAHSSDGSIIASVGSRDLYDLRTVSCVRKDELNIKITACGDDHLIIRNLPLLDAQTLREFRHLARSQQYFHLGCCTVTLTPLFHHAFIRNYGKQLKGMIALVDTTFEDPLQGVIASFKFDLGQGRVDFISMPNHALSLTDPNLADRLSVVVMMDAMKVKTGNEMFNLAIGWAGVTSNTLNPSLRHTDEQYPIANAEELKFSDFPPEFTTALNRCVQGCLNPALTSALLQDRDDEFLQQRRLFGLLKGRTIKVRRLRLVGVASEKERDGSEASSSTTPPPLGRSVSTRPCSQVDSSWLAQARSSTSGLEDGLYQSTRL